MQGLISRRSIALTTSVSGTSLCVCVCALPGLQGGKGLRLDLDLMTLGCGGELFAFKVRYFLLLLRSWKDVRDI